MKRLIRKILREEINKSDKYYRFLDKISSIIEKPYIRNMYERFNGGFWDITDLDDQEYIIRKIFGGDITIDYLNGDIFIYNTYDEIIYSENPIGGWNKREYDDNGNILYSEDSRGYWDKYEYDDNGNLIYKGESSGWWKRYEYDDNGKRIYLEDSDGDWIKYEYDDRGNQIYREHSNGYWVKKEYDDKGNKVYQVTSDGYIRDNR